MILKIKRPSIRLILCFLLLFASKAHAEDDYRDHQLHLRLGMINTSISGGGISSSYSVTNSIDLEYEIFSNPKSSTVIRGIIAHDLKLDRTVYDFMGVGKRFYVFSSGISEHASGNGFEIDHVPKRRFYFGFDVGYSNGVILVLQNTPLQTVSSLIDAGALAGFLYQISRSYALEIQGGYSFGYGFSGISATAQTMRLFVGIAHGF